jgi:hypothetical protein
MWFPWPGLTPPIAGEVYEPRVLDSVFARESIEAYLESLQDQAGAHDGDPLRRLGTVRESALTPAEYSSLLARRVYDPVTPAYSAG